MHSLCLKVINAGIQIDADNLSSQLKGILSDEGFEFSENAPLTIKIKFLVDNEHELVLIQLRETVSKVKLREKVIPFLSVSWLNDTVMEVNALVNTSLELELS